MDRNYRREWAEGEIEAGTLLDAIDQLRAEAAALRKDAERYRWLTDGKRGDYCWYNVLSENQRATHHDLEGVIDAAMAAKEG